jgi:hypothetical protein
MNSPQPLSASQRGAKFFTPPSFACKRRGPGDEYMKKEEQLLFIPNSQYILLSTMLFFPVILKDWIRMKKEEKGQS